MSIRVMTFVWDARLPTAEKIVLLVIADHANDDGSNAWPSIATIARKASMSERSVQRHIKSLEQAGVLRVEQQGGGTAKMRSDRRPNRYDVVLDAIHGVTDATSTEVDGVTDETSRGDNDASTGCQTEHHGVTRVSPNPSLEPSVEPSLETLSSDDDFNRFWAQYPRKVQKRTAALRWKNMTKRDRLAALVGIEQHVERWRSKGTEERFIPHPATWLYGRRWEDELESDWTPDPQPNLSRAAQTITEMIRHATDRSTTDRGLPRGPITGLDG